MANVLRRPVPPLLHACALVAIAVLPSRSPVLAQSPPPGSLAAQQIVQRLQRFYGGVRQYDADFDQTSQNRLSGTVDRRDGHVRFERPQRMRWDYSHPAGDVIVSDGSTLWAYEVAARQAARLNLQQSAMPSALAFLTGAGRLTSEFTIQLRASAPAPFYYLVLTPIHPNPSIASVLLVIEPVNFQVTSSVITDGQRNTTRIDFIAPHVNVAPPAHVFEWTPPPGTHVVQP